MEVTHRHCKRCDSYYPNTNAHWVSRPHRPNSPNCKVCAVIRTKEYRSRNTDRTTAQNKQQKTKLSTRYSHLNSSAKRRGLVVEITGSEYVSIVSQGCSYCKVPLDGETGTSLDRIDNDKGYTLSNVVACCGLCNITRNRLYSHSEFLKYIAPAIRAVRNERYSCTR